MSARCLASKALAFLGLLHTRVHEERTLAATAHVQSGRSGCHAENDVCVIGAGGSAMRAAVALRDRGYRVLVLERQNQVRRQIKLEGRPSGPSGPSGRTCVMLCDHWPA